MPKKSTFYTRNKDLVDSLRQQGKSWEDVAKALADIGDPGTKAGIHYAYQSYQRQQAASGQEDEPLEVKPIPQAPIPGRAWDEAEAARVSGTLDASAADQVRQWTISLSYYSSVLANDYLETCKEKTLEACLQEFEKRLQIVKEVAKNVCDKEV